MSSRRPRVNESLGRPGDAAARPMRPLNAPPLNGPSPPRSAPPRKTSAAGESRSRGMLLNKRQSISHASAEAAGYIPPSSRAPAVPSLPSTSQRRLGPGGLDLDDLAKDDFDAEQYVKTMLPAGAANLDTLRKLKSNLQDTLESTNGELQANVLKNYSEFVTISKEIATLEADMLDLKVILEEWKGVPSSLEIATDPASDFDLGLGASLTNPRRAQRNSIADLAALHRTQLQSLWENVEGAQRFVPPTPGRHIIAESAAFNELNSATYTPRQGVHLFLLNDSLLVAVKKRTGVTTADPGPTSTPGTSKMRLVADRCYALSDIVVVDLKDGGDLSNAIKIKKGKQTSIFRSERPEEKRALLQAFKKVAEELMAKKRKQSLWEAETRKERSGGPGGSLGPLAGFSPSQHFGFGKDDPSGKDLSWIGDFADELAVCIALHDYEAGVDLIEKGRTAMPKVTGDAHASALLRLRHEERSAELSEAVLRELADVHVGKAQVVKCAAWLLRLGEGDRARERFLATRAQLVRKRARQIKFEGDVSLYVSELAMVCFTLIKNTCEWYMAAFKENTMASGFVRWASQQIEAYAEMFRRQVYGPDQNPVVIEESLAVTRSHALMLRDVGLDMAFHLDRELIATPSVVGR